ncbi:MAG: hypothetical protein R6U91_07815 [Bacillota bacterium]
MPKPKEMPQLIGQVLVTQKGMDPDVVWALKCALRPHPQSKTRFDFRVFSSNAAQNAGVKVANFDSLETHTELVIFHGWYDKRSNQIEFLDSGNAAD